MNKNYLCAKRWCSTYASYESNSGARHRIEEKSRTYDRVKWIMFNLTENPLTEPRNREDLVSPEAGAIVTFEGRVRRHNRNYEVEALEYSAYPELAENEAEKIMTEAREEFDVEDVLVQHRTGRLEVTECSVRVAASAVHREDAFQAAKWVIDEVKQRLPIWKKEIYTDGSERWINRPPSSENRMNPSG